MSFLRQIREYVFLIAREFLEYPDSFKLKKVMLHRQSHFKEMEFEESVYGNE
jgi:hypothetical protein